MEQDEQIIVDRHVDGFEAEDALFSRTDERGIIKAGNRVFVRLSEYEREDLHNAPHRIVRHPDMPKSVFHLMWSMLQRGKVFGGYVKNRTATGLYYWVFAVVTPIADGYLSVRIKPQSDLFNKAQDLYKDLKAQEQKDGFDPTQAESRIIQHITPLGFSSYEQFMTEALYKEISDRPDLASSYVSRNLQKFSKMSESLEQLGNDVEQVRELFTSIRNVPVNLNLAGARHGELGRAIQVVAANYSELSTDLMHSVQQMSDGLEHLVEEAYHGQMSYCASVILEDAIEKFTKEDPLSDQESHDREIALVTAAFSNFLDDTAKDCAQIGGRASHFSRINIELRKHLSALSVTRVTCRIEAAALGDGTDGIHEIADRLDGVQTELTHLLDSISADCLAIADAVPKMEDMRTLSAA